MDMEFLTAIGAVLFAIWGGYERYLRVTTSNKTLRNLNGDYIEKLMAASNDVVDMLKIQVQTLQAEMAVLSTKIARLEGLIVKYGCQETNCPYRTTVDIDTAE